MPTLYKIGVPYPTYVSRNTYARALGGWQQSTRHQATHCFCIISLCHLCVESIEKIFLLPTKISAHQTLILPI